VFGLCHSSFVRHLAIVIRHFLTSPFAPRPSPVPIVTSLSLSSHAPVTALGHLARMETHKIEVDWCGAADQPCVVPVQPPRRNGPARRWRTGWNKRGELLELWECGFAVGGKRRDLFKAALTSSYL
jgi:hypothetical protein